MKTSNILYEYTKYIILRIPCKINDGWWVDDKNTDFM